MVQEIKKMMAPAEAPQPSEVKVTFTHI